MLKRKIETAIKEYFQGDNDKILVIDGARQVGKSFIIRETAKRYFKNYVEINMVEDSEGDKLFKDASSLSSFYLSLGAAAGEKLGAYDDTLVFLDEIQVYPQLLTLLKFLKSDKRYRYIVSGSQLDITLSLTTSIPMGAVDILEMYPLDFEEFLWANGIKEDFISSLRQCLFHDMNIPEGVHNTVMRLFRQYLLIGGLPEPVSEYIQNENIVRVRKLHDEIRRFYEIDASKYDREHKLRIADIYRHLPSFMEQKKKRIVFKDLGGCRASDFLEEFDYLVASGIALEVDAVSNPVYPLSMSEVKNLLKLYMNDTGLLSSILFGRNIKAVMSDECSVNLGSLYETAVAMELKAHGYHLYYYDNKAKGEVDFLINDEESLSIIPLEIKSGRDYKIHSAISSFVSNVDYNTKTAYVLSNSSSIETKGGITYLPIYAVMFFSR